MLLPENVKDSTIWMNGEFKNWSEGKIHMINHGLHYASSVFEGERVYNGKIFKSKEHSERLIRSAAILKMDVDFSVEDIEKAKKEVVAKCGYENAYLRCFVWRGGEGMGISAPSAKINIAIATWEWPSYFSKELHKTGISLLKSPWRKPSPETAPVKSKAAGLYMIGTLSKIHANENGYNDALMLDYRGYVAESSGANLFSVKNGEIITPTPDCFLNGITRLTIIDLAKEAGIKVTEKHISYDELMEADEIFLTGTAAEVTPVGKIDDQTFKIGPVTKQMMTDYAKLVRS